MAVSELSAQTGYAGADLDRQSDRREDQAYIAALENDPRSRFLVLTGEEAIFSHERGYFRALFTRREALAFGPPQEIAFLGREATCGLFAVLLAKTSQNIDPGPEFLSRLYKGEAGEPRFADGQIRGDLRTMLLQGWVDEKVAGRLALAKSLMHWHARHKFCANCGQPTQSAAAGWKRICAACASEHFPRTDPVVIMLATSGEKCLLGRQPKFPPGMYSALAGFVESGETLENAVRREIWEEAGLEIGTVTYLASQPWPFPGQLMIGCLAEALSENIEIDATELEDARWFSRDEAWALVEGAHPKFFCPPKLAIAYNLLAAWATEARPSAKTKDSI